MVNLLFIWLFVSMGSLSAECCTYLHTGWHDFATGNLNFPVDVIYQNVYKHIMCRNLFCNWFFLCLNSGRYTEILHSGVQLTFCSVQILRHISTTAKSSTVVPVLLQSALMLCLWPVNMCTLYSYCIHKSSESKHCVEWLYLFIIFHTFKLHH